MKKTLALLMALIMVMCAVAACGGNGTTTTTVNTTTNTTNTTGTTGTTGTTSTTGTTAQEPETPTEVPPVLWLDFEEENIDDDIVSNVAGDGLDAEIMGEVDIVEGPVGNAIHFPTADDVNYLYIENDERLNFTTEDEFTIDFWYKVDADAVGWDNLFQKGARGTGWYGVWLSTSDSYGVCWGGDTGNYKVGPLDSGVWHNMTIVQKGGILYTFIDGERVGAIKAVDFTSSTDLFLGGGALTKEEMAQFQGSIDEFKIYDYAKDLAIGAVVSEQDEYAPVAIEGQGPVLWLDFEASNVTDTTVKNAAGEGLDATIVGEVATIAGPTSDTAFLFGSSEEANYLQIANNDALNFTTADEFTIDFWYMLDLEAVGWDTIFQKGAKNDGWYGVWLGQSDSSTQGVCWGGDTGNSMIGSVASKYQWHHITVIMKDGKITTYLNGTKVKTFTAKNFTSTSDLFIGGAAADGSVQQFQGAIDDFKIYDYAFVAPTVPVTVADQAENAPTATEGKNPVLWLDFESTNLTETTVKNAAGDGLDATIVGTVTSIAGPTSANAMEFGKNSASGYLQIANNDALNFTTADEFTIDFWYMIDTDAVGWDNLFSKGAKGEGWYGVWLATSDSASGGVCWGGDTGNHMIGSVNSRNKWHHITVIQKNGTLYTYLDGVQIGTIEAVNCTSTTDFFIGANSDASGQFQGAIDDFKVYNYAFDITAE